MKKSIHFLSLTACLGLYAELLNAQPVISTANMPVNGDSVIIGICSNPVVPGPPGAAQTWNMSNLTETQQGYFKFIPPSQTYWGYQFPNANICGRSWVNSYAYYNSNVASFEQVGSCLLLDTVPPPNDTVKSVYNNFEELLNFPFNFNDMVTDSFNGNNYAFGLTQAFNGDINVEADGYGTLILPNGTYNNVVRYHFTRNQYSTLAPPQLKEQWGWISEDHRFWLLLMETIDDGFATSSLVWFNKQPILTTGIQVNAKPSIDFYPNPVKQGEQLFISWKKAEQVSIEIIDVTGKTEHAENRMLSEGNNIFDIAHKIKSPGIYFVRIFNDDFILNERLAVLK